MRILFILEYYHPHIGGVETLFKSLTEELSKKGNQITVLTNRYVSSLAFKEKSGNITIYRLPFFNRYIFTFFAFFPALFFAFKNDIIHTTSYNAGIPSYFAGLFSGRKVIITFHEAWGKLWLRLPFFSKISLRLHYLFEAFLLKLPFYRFIAVSDATKHNLIAAGINENKIVRIYNGIDYEQMAQLQLESNYDENRNYTFLYFGRLGISKGLDLLLKAIHILKSKSSDFNTQIIIPRSPENLYREIMRMVHELKISDRINFYHELERNVLFSLVKQANAVVIPSYSEGFCYTAVESMALGKPIISSQQGALKEVISGKYLNFEPLDADGLAHAMEKAMDENWLMKPIRKFSFSDTVEQYVHLYENLI